MEEKKKNKQELVNEEQELDLDQLEKVSGGSLAFVKKEKTKDINDDVASRF